jgi:hypothetical protein
VPAVPAAVTSRLAEGADDARLLADLLAQHQTLEALAAAEQRRVRALMASLPSLPAVQVPLLADDVHDLAGLRRLGAELFA